uniref:Uncharacterized protein n=1 Tax=Arundo donax TaxID=35708 RepID=A0A0A9CYK4_ARUDO
MHTDTESSQRNAGRHACCTVVVVVVVLAGAGASFRAAARGALWPGMQ